MSDANMITLNIDGHDVSVPAGSTIMQAAEKLAIEIPHFCYHKRLSIAGNCRMCLVEVEGAPKPVASCHWPASEGMVVKTQSEQTQEARKGTMEFLLINHPLDCPICDQAGECSLQDISLGYGSDCSRFEESKRAVEDKDIGEKIKTVMTRCIHCTRCVRFATEIAGVEEFGAVFRGENTKIGTYVEHALQSELSGNMIDLCPVGALTSKPYAFTGRPWELKETNSIDIMDGLGTNISVHHRAGKVMRVVPRENEDVNEEWMADSGRFSYDMLNENRLTTPLVRKGKSQKSCGWQQAFKALDDVFEDASPLSIAALAGSQQSAEDYYAFNAFMKNTIGTDSVDVRPERVALKHGNRKDYLFNSGITGVEEADILLLVGANPKLESPVLNARIRRQVTEGKLEVVRIGANEDLTYPVTQLGETPEDLVKLCNARNATYKKLAAAKRPMIIAGVESALSRTDGVNIYKAITALTQKINAVNVHWNGLNILHQTAGLVAGLDMSVHPEKSGMDTAKILRTLKKGDVETLVLYGDHAGITPDLARMAKNVVYIGTHKTALAKIADICLPTAAYTEKQSYWTNMEGRVQNAEQAVMPPMNAKEDWKVFRALSERLGEALPFDSLDELRSLLVKVDVSYEKAHIGERVSEVTATDVETVDVKTLKLNKSAFKAPVESYYLNNALLNESSTMHKCAAEKDNKNNILRKAS